MGYPFQANNRGSAMTECEFDMRLFLIMAVISLISSNAVSDPANNSVLKPLRLGVAVTGVIKEITVSENAHVTSRQALLKIDCHPLEEEMRTRNAELEAAKAAYERTRNGPRPEEIDIGVANLGVATARAEEADAAFKRANALVSGVTITQAQYLHVQRDVRVSNAQLEDAKKRLALLRAGSRHEDIEEAAAKRNEAASFLEETKARLEQCTVYAPVAGTVHLNATLGQLVSTFAPATLIELMPDAGN
jgi:multidrug resistance efflux pump